MENKSKLLPAWRAWLTPSGAVVMGVCFFLPWARFSCSGWNFSVSGADLGGALWLLPVAAVIILAAFFALKGRKREQISLLITLLATVIAVIALSWKLISIATGPKPAFGLIKPHDVGFRLDLGGIGVVLGLVGVIFGGGSRSPKKDSHI